MNHDAPAQHDANEVEHAVRRAATELRRAREAASGSPGLELTAAQVGDIGAQLIELAKAAMQLAMHFTDALIADLTVPGQPIIADRDRSRDHRGQ